MALYSDMNGFPESGFPVLADVQDRIVLNTLYYNPLKHSDYKIDVVGNSRLYGALVINGGLSGVSTLAMGGALSGVTTLGANNTVTLSHDTAPLTISGTNAVISISGVNSVISMPGLNASIGTKLFRIRRAFFTDLDTANSPTVNGEPVMTRMDCVQCANVQNAYADGKVAQTITDGVTTSAPSQDVVFDALAGKSNTNHDHSGVYAPALGTDDNYVTDTEKAALHAHSNKTALDNVSNTNTGDETQSTIKTKLGAATASVDGYATSTQITKLDGIAEGANVGVVPNVAITGATKTKITYDAKGLVTSGADATTADIADSLNKRYVTDANLTVIGNTSGTNTGDNATNSQYSGLAASKADLASPTFTGTVTLPSRNVLPTDGQILLTIPSSDGHATGNVTDAFNSGYTSSAVGDLVYLDSSSTWQKCDMDTSAATYSGLVGIALEVKASGNALKVALPGSFVYCTAFPALTVGSPVYMSDAGAITQTQPNGADDAIRMIGWAVHADKIYFYPSPDYIVHT